MPALDTGETMRNLVGVAVFLALSGCGPKSTELRCTDATETAPMLGENFTIRYHESATVQNEGLTLIFAELVNDSRCPSGAECAVAGNAEVRVSAVKNEQPQDLSLNTGPDHPTQAIYQNYTVQLVSLVPYPTDHHPAAADSCIGLRVTRTQ
jgi:hypothetical protein